jgi:transcription elongation factor Elf1
MMEEHNPCPFCNGAILRVHTVFEDKSHEYILCVECSNCNARGPTVKSRDKVYAYKKWDERI